MSSSRGGSKAAGRDRRLESLKKKQESGFQVWRTGSELPEYKAELDPYCPRAQVRKYNQDKKLDAEEKASRVKNSTGFIKKKIHSSFEDVPLKMNPTLRAKATSAASSSRAGLDGTAENVVEVEILQKVIVRENLLEELKKLLANQTDVTGCLPEVIELVKAIRYQTVEIIEEISDWQAKQPTRRAFLYRGMNYLTKIFEDLSFLDLYEDIVAKFCFEFTGNPLGYRGGGDIVTGPGGNVHGEGMQRLAEFYNDNQGSFDGIEIVRLRNAERVIQMEFDRLDKEKKIFAKQQALQQSMTPQQRAAAAADGGMAIGELGMGSVVDGGGSVEIMMSQDELAAASTNIQQQEAVTEAGAKGILKKGDKVPRADPRKWRQKFNPRKVKMERIQCLTSEADELRAMETHLEDQINTMVTQHHEYADKRKVAEQKRREALSLNKDVAAQHITVEISMYTSDMQELNSKIKDLQRQIYFIAIDRNRKRKVAKKLKDELKLEKKRQEMEKELSQKVKEGGLLNALKTLNTMQSQELEGKLGMAGPQGEAEPENPILEYIHKFQEDSIAEAKQSPERYQVQFEENEREFGEQARSGESLDGIAEGAAPGAFDHLSTRELADAALAGMRAGRSTLGDDPSLESSMTGADANMQIKPDDGEEDGDVAVGSAMALARSRGNRRPSDGSNAKVLLQQALDKLEYGEYGEAREILEDVLNPVEGSTKTTDELALLGCYVLLAEWHRGLAQYEDAESLYTQCMNDVENLVLPTEDTHLKTTLHLRILVGYADLLRNLCLYDDLDSIMYKAEKMSTSLNASLLKEGANGFRLAVAECRTSQAAYLVAKGDYDEAERLHREALDVRRLVLGLDHFKVASSLSHLGYVALLKSDFRKATRLIGESLAMREAIFPNNHPAIAASLYLKGRLLHTMGQYKEAGSLLAKSLQMRRLCVGQRHPSVGASLLAVAELSRAMGLPLKANESYMDARAVVQKRFPDGGRCHGHKLMVEVLVGLGNNAYSMHSYAQALNYFDEATRRHEMHLPEKAVAAHIFREVLHLKRAKTLVRMDRFDEAKEVISASGQTVVSKLGNDHYLVAEGLLIFGILCSLTAKYAQAHLLLMRCKEMFTLNFGEEHPVQVEVMYANAENMRLPGYFEDAVHEEGKAMALGMAIFGPKTSHRAESLAQRAIILREIGKHKEAVALFHESLALMEETVGAASAAYAQVHGEYGECLRVMGNHSEAAKVLQKAKVLSRAAFAGEEDKGEGGSRHVHSSVALFQMYTAQVLLDEGKPDQALELLEGEVYPPLRSLLGSGHPMTLFSKALLALCLQRSKTPRSERSQLSVDLLEEQPQDIIDEILETFDTHDGGKSPLSDSHPWVLALGGYLLDTARSSNNNTARNAHARLSARDSARNSARSARGAGLESVSVDGGDGGGGGVGAPIDPEIVPWDAPGKEGTDFDRIQGKIVFRSIAKFDGDKAREVSDLQAGLNLARDRFEMGKFDEAKDVVEEVLKARRRLQMGNNRTIIATRLQLAEWHRAMAQYKHAEGLYAKCLAVMQSQDAESFEERAELHLGIIVGMADLYRNTCQYSDVRKSHEEAQRVISEAEDQESGTSSGFRLAVAECRTSQAAYLVAKGDYDEAERLHREALDVRRLVLGLDHFKVASSLSHLGYVALLKSDFRKATRLIGESLAMREAIFPNNHPAIAASLYLKGRLLHTMGQYKEAGELIVKAQALRKATLGAKHPAVSQCVWATAEITTAMGYPDRAEELYDSSLLMRQQYYPELELGGGKVVWHTTVVESIAGSAAMAEAKGDYRKAAETYSEAITQFHRLCTTLDISDGSHPLMAILQTRLAALYVALNKPSEAKRLLKAAGDIVYTKLGDSNIYAAHLHHSLGLLSNLQGWYRDAHECYTRARKVLWVLFRKKMHKQKDVQKLDLKGAGLGSGSGPDSLTVEVLTTPVDTLAERRIDYKEIDPDFKDAKNDATHPLTASILQDMAYNMSINGPGYSEQAEKINDRAFDIRKDLFGRSVIATNYDGSNKGMNEVNLHAPCFASSMMLRGQICAMNREFGTAQNSFELALKISHASVGEESALFSVVFACYGAYLLQRAEAALNSQDGGGNAEALFEEADDTLSKALMLLRTQLGDGHWMVAETMQQISFLLLYRGQVEEALALMKDGALPLFEEALNHSNPRTLFVGGCVGVCLQAVAKAHDGAHSQSGADSMTSGGSVAHMASSGRELVKSTLNFFRLYAQGALVASHPWVVSIGGYDVLLQKPARPATADGTAEDGSVSLASSDVGADREVEEIREDLDLIPAKPEIGLLFNSNISNLKDLMASWGL